MWSLWRFTFSAFDCLDCVTIKVFQAKLAYLFWVLFSCYNMSLINFFLSRYFLFVHSDSKILLTPTSQKMFPLSCQCCQICSHQSHLKSQNCPNLTKPSNPFLIRDHQHPMCIECLVWLIQLIHLLLWYDQIYGHICCIVVYFPLMASALMNILK